MGVTLGSIVVDSLTGFAGTATARTEFLYGCVRILVEPKELKDGKPVEGQWIDEQRLTAVSKAKRGGPGPTPPARPAPSR